MWIKRTDKMEKVIFNFKKEISFASLGGVMELVLEALGSALPTDEKEVKNGKN